MKTPKEKKPKAPKPPKEKPSEQELVRRYANRTIKNALYHGRVDGQKFAGLQHDKTVSKDLWLDTDFYFSVVFQSSEQKYEFLKGLSKRFPNCVTIDEKNRIQIVNGLNLATAFAIPLTKVTTKDFPTGNLDLKSFVLDTEIDD
ncbi:hypothetical protein phi1422_0040 [Bdellovibrio phage phi1422]|uniref:hypothetical protein n=1 Tax=Bdellovibrio phage phi1422 TaxID=1127515 RepID=UPI0002536D5C|nr:hypothetical protein F395_gp40 [Bdellovibrio phage phi1422]AFC22560.1 hypothetical protein phi1422_0040 [Bdellovibrio phage phi1422]